MDVLSGKTIRSKRGASRPEDKLCKQKSNLLKKIVKNTRPYDLNLRELKTDKLLQTYTRSKDFL